MRPRRNRATKEQNLFIANGVFEFELLKLHKSGRDNIRNKPNRRINYSSSYNIMTFDVTDQEICEEQVLII